MTHIDPLTLNSLGGAARDETRTFSMAYGFSDRFEVKEWRSKKLQQASSNRICGSPGAHLRVGHFPLADVSPTSLD